MKFSKNKGLSGEIIKVKRDTENMMKTVNS